MSKIVNKKYQISLIISSLLVFGCNFNQIENIKNNDIYQIKASSKNGAELSFKISLKQNTFNLKANEVGSISKTISDIDHYIVYLVKNSNTSSYPSGGDPIGDAILGPITIPASSSEQVKITGLDNSSGDAYYIAVRAQDSSNNDLIKDNNGDLTPWSGDTASSTLKIAVSDFGAVVNSSLVVSPKSNLVVTINLIDEVGNSLGVNTSVNNGALIRSTSRILENYITTIAGGAIGGFNGDGDQATSSTTMLDNPQGVAIDSLGNMYISDSDNHRIRKVDTSGVITTIAGSGSATTGALLGDGGQATSARLNSPFGITLDKNNNIYICDGFNNRIRKVDTSGVITTIAGTTGGSSGDGGPATDAQLNQPYGITTDDIGNIYFSDSLNNKVRKIDINGIITTVAGTTSGFSGDGGPATDAKLRSPRGIFIDKLSNLYISDLTNNLIRKVNKAGIITTIAGNTSALVLGDGGQATAAKLSSPEGVLIDLSGNLYISDKSNNLIRKVNASGIITTITGTTSGFSGDGGLSISSKIKTPALLTMDSFGNLYIADKGNNRIRKIYAN